MDCPDASDEVGCKPLSISSGSSTISSPDGTNLNMTLPACQESEFRCLNKVKSHLLKGNKAFHMAQANDYVEVNIPFSVLLRSPDLGL